MAISVASFCTDLPIWAPLIALLIGAIIIVTKLKTKLIIENGQLRYETLTNKGEPIDLQRVAQIVIREVETIVDNANSSNNSISNISRQNQTVNQERKVERFIYVLDSGLHTIISFPLVVISFKDRNRFRLAIRAANPNIELF